MGSAGAGIVCVFRVTRTLEQDGRDSEGFHAAVLSPRPGEAQVSPALEPEKAPSPWTQRSLKRTDWRGYRDEAANPPLRLPKDCRANIECIRYRDQ